jgi:plastocyanin
LASSRAFLAAAVLAAASFAIPASSLPAAKTAAAKPPAVIVINKLMFGPAPAGLHVGDVVEWANHDIFEHTATAKDGSFDLDLNPGASGRVVLKRAGMITYICSYHPGMTGVLRVAK